MRAKFEGVTLLVVGAIAIALVPQTGTAAERSGSCVDTLSAKAAGEIAHLKSDYAKIAPADTRRSTDLKRLSLLRAVDQSSRGGLINAIHGCGVELSFSALRPFAMVMDAADQWDQEQLREILSRIGWPVISRYGIDADKTAFLIVQHATGDPSFQREILSTLEKLLAAKETAGENYALLFDRVHEAEGGRQRFGTQGQCHGKTWISDPIEDTAGVNGRRAVLGMPPLAQYNAISEKLYCRK